jgi:hypothetical protein
MARRRNSATLIHVSEAWGDLSRPHSRRGSGHRTPHREATDGHDDH